MPDATAANKDSINKLNDVKTRFIPNAAEKARIPYYVMILG